MNHKNEHVINRLYNFDLDIFQSGYHKLSSNKFYGPTMRDHYLLHFVISGQGILLLNDKLYKISAGQAFIIFPNQTSFYQADEFDPWEYTWIGFNGLKADSFIKNLNLTPSSNPIITFESEPLCFKELREIDKTSEYDEVKLLGLLYLTFYDLLKQKSTNILNVDSKSESTSIYTDKAMDYINKNYYKKLSMEDIANHVGLNKNYLSNIFKATFNIPIKNYIVGLKIKNACELLKETNMSIYEVANAVGYDDTFQFSKIFKKYTNHSPKGYRSFVNQNKSQPK